MELATYDQTQAHLKTLSRSEKHELFASICSECIARSPHIKCSHHDPTECMTGNLQERVAEA